MKNQINQTTINQVVLTQSKETRGRKVKWTGTMSRAWIIARNCANFFNTNPSSIAKRGLVKASQFIGEALRLAWKELKSRVAGATTKQFRWAAHSIPRKSISKLNEAIISIKEDLENKGYKQDSDLFKIKMATAVAELRGKKGEVSQLNQLSLT